jgi:DtxR family transcriptional regulator, Mn-dependent transcriptional regulator
MRVRPLSGESAEMYLKSLLELGGDQVHVPISMLAVRLDVSPISATERVHRLQAEAQLDHQPYQGVRLTHQGRSAALRVIRRHRLWECFLHDQLGLAWDQVHAIACQLEHVVGDEVAEALAAHLGEPSACPHGNPIPSGTRDWRRTEGVRLDELAPGQRAVLLCIEGESPEVLAQLAQAGMRPGVRLRREVSPSSGLLRLQIAGRPARLTAVTAQHVLVAVED